MSFRKGVAVTGFMFGLINKNSALPLTGGAASITGFITADGGTQAALSGTFEEEGNGSYSINLTAAEMDATVINLVFLHPDAVPAFATIRTTAGTTTTGTEATLSIGYSKLRTEVGFYLGYDRDPDNWSAAEAEIVDCIIESGLRQFYHPPPVLGEKLSHKWRFLEPTTTIDTVASVDSYQLPAEFGGMTGPITFITDDNRWTTLIERDENFIRQARMRDQNNITSYPLNYAIRPYDSDGSDGQRWELMLWPKPDKVYTLQYRYHAYQDRLSVDNPWPLGGSAHGETILQSCLQIAEQRLENSSGVQRDKFMERLAASVSHDRLQYTPDNAGYNRDYSDGRFFSEQDNRRFFGNVVDYNGQQPLGG